MKKILNLLVLTLAVNFIFTVAAIAWLYQSGHLDKDRVHAVKDIVFPATQPAASTTQPTTEPSPPTSDQQIDELLNKALGKGTAQEQNEYIRSKIDQSMHEMDLRKRELQELQNQVTEANRKLLDDRKALEAEKKALADREQQSDKLANDAGFQETLALYIKMPPKKSKALLQTMDDTKVANYLSAMEPNVATKIINEFGAAPEEKVQIKRILEKMSTPRPAVAASSAGESKE